MDRKSESFILTDQLEWESVAIGVKRQIMGYDDNIMQVKVAFERGAIGERHTHIHSQTTYVASGKFLIEINGKRQTLSLGDGFYVEPDAPHSAECLEEGVLIDIFTPIREEFLS